MPSKRVTAGMYFPDPNNPGQKLFKWFRDDWSRRKIVAIEGAGYQTSTEVSAAIAAAIGGITELEYLVVSALPASGTKGVIYLVPHSHGTSDIYDEYIWVNNTFEKIGNTDVDLSQYLLKTDIATWAKQPNKPTYTASEVGALPSSTSIPTKTSDLTNDSGFITGYTETDPTVPAWAKASAKPTYTATEVGALPDTTPIPSKTSDLTNDSGYITGYTETDPTVPNWAKQSTKPSYTAAEVGAQPTLSAAQLDAVNSGITASDIAVNDASVLCPVTPTVPTLQNGATHYASYGGCYYYKIGHRVSVHIGVSSLTAATKTRLFTLPAGYRPKAHIGSTGVAQDIMYYSRIQVTPDGYVYIYSEGRFAYVDVTFDAFQ